MDRVGGRATSRPLEPGSRPEQDRSQLPGFPPHMPLPGRPRCPGPDLRVWELTLDPARRRRRGIGRLPGQSGPDLPSSGWGKIDGLCSRYQSARRRSRGGRRSPRGDPPAKVPGPRANRHSRQPPSVVFSRLRYAAEARTNPIASSDPPARAPPCKTPGPPRIPRQFAAPPDASIRGVRRERH